MSSRASMLLLRSFRNSPGIRRTWLINVSIDHQSFNLNNMMINLHQSRNQFKSRCLPLTLNDCKGMKLCIYVSSLSCLKQTVSRCYIHITITCYLVNLNMPVSRATATRLGHGDRKTQQPDHSNQESFMSIAKPQPSSLKTLNVIATLYIVWRYKVFNESRIWSSFSVTIPASFRIVRIGNPNDYQNLTQKIC